MAKRKNDPLSVTPQLINNLQAQTDGHKEYIRAIIENDYVLVKGPPGSSKSFTATGIACEFLVRQKVEQIVLIRPMVQTGLRNLGILPGNIDEKYSCYLIPLFEHMGHFLGTTQLRRLQASNIIKTLPLEIAKGMNFHDSFVIVDEAENCDYNQLSMIMCRVCEGSKIVINGDLKQSDLKHCDFGDVFDKLKGLHGVGCIELTNKDIMRSGMIAKILNRLEN